MRRSQQKNRTVASHFSQFAASGFHLPVLGEIVNDMGDPLDHGFDEADPEGNTTQGDMPIAGPSCVHAARFHARSYLPVPRWNLALTPMRPCSSTGSASYTISRVQTHQSSVVDALFHSARHFPLLWERLGQPGFRSGTARSETKVSPSLGLGLL